MRDLTAETLALKGLAYIAADSEVLDRFLALSGLEIEDLRQRAADLELLAAVVDFICSDEKLAENFAMAEGIDSGVLRRARAYLPGGQD